MRAGFAVTLVVFTLLVVTELSGQSGPNRTSPIAATIDQRLQAAVGRGDVPGVVALAVDRQGVIYRTAIGEAELGTGRAVEASTIFRVASMAKAVTSVALMQLVEQHRVGLDDPAERYLPALAHLAVFDSFDAATGVYRVHPARTPVTVRQLMTHTSGLGYAFTSAVLRDFKAQPGETYVAGPLLFEPGERWWYGASTDWVGRIVEAVSGQTLEDYCQEKILHPLGMPDTSFNVAPAKLARLATNHQRSADGSLAPIPAEPPPVMTSFRGGGGLYSTAEDYGRLVRMLLREGELDGVRILSPATVRSMGTNQIGRLGVPALKTALPQMSNDFTFIDDGRDKWGLGFLINTTATPGKRSAGSLSWGGVNNTYFWIDHRREVAGVVMMQLMPFADPKALSVYDTFERGIYQLTDAQARPAAARRSRPPS